MLVAPGGGKDLHVLTKPSIDRAAVIRIAGRVVAGVSERDLTGLAQQIAYNILFALGPLLIFMTAFCGLITQRVNSDAQNPVEPVTDWLAANLPSSAANFLEEPVANALTTSPGFLLSIGGLLALWGAKGAMSAIIKGLNAAYGIEESRSWIAQTGTAIGLTVALAVSLLVTSALFFLGTDTGADVAGAIGLGQAWSTFSTWARWPVLVAIVTLLIVLFHQYAPDHKAPLRSYLPGAVFTIVATLLAAVGLSIYFQVSGGFTEAYGAFGAVLAFVFYLFVESLVILLGGLVNVIAREEGFGATPTEAT